MQNRPFDVVCTVLNDEREILVITRPIVFRNLSARVR